jgi:hypothetical protein
LPSAGLLGKEALCQVPEKKHSAKYLTLGKDFFSGSELGFRSVLVQINNTIEKGWVIVAKILKIQDCL